MISVIIVDDEVLIREGLKMTIPWQEYGFEIVGEAENGEEAFELYQKLRPDVVISDIRMADMSGLELLNKIREISQTTEFVIISGYSSFDYAQEAIADNVFAYILKPFKDDEIIDVMERLKKKINRERNLNEKKTIMQEDILGILLHESMTAPQEVDRVCAEQGINIPKSNYIVAALQIDKVSELSNLNNITTVFLKTINYIISLEEYYIMYSRIDKANIIMAIFTDEPDYLRIYEMLLSIKNRFFSLTEKTITIGVSGFFHKISMLSRAYNQATTALSQKTFMGNDRIIDYIEISSAGNETLVLSENVLKGIIENIKNGVDNEKIIEPLEEYFCGLKSVGKLNIEAVKSSITELAILILHLIVKNEQTMESLFGRVLLPVVEIQNMELISEIKEYIYYIIDKARNHSDVSKIYSYSAAVRKIVLYMMENYAKAITAESVAQEFYMSPYHLMHIFKKETGKTFNEYLSEYRINIAQELLKTGKYRVYEVAYLVGYKNARHFSKKFKNITGKSPSDNKGAE